METIKFFGNKPEVLIEPYVIVRKSEDIKRFGYGSRYSEQTAFLRDRLGERSPQFNNSWRQGW